MKTFGIILIVLQVFSLFGGVANGSLVEMLHITNALDISELAGYFLPALLGIFLYVKGKKKKSSEHEE